MIHAFFHLVFASLAVYIAAYLIPGVTVEPYWVAIIVAVVLGLVNTLIKPIISFLTLPINILTLGLFSLVINAALILGVAHIVNGFTVGDFFDALLFSIILWFVNWFFSLFKRG